MPVLSRRDLFKTIPIAAAPLAVGQTAEGRYLKVIYVRDDRGDGVFVITAYDLDGKPLKAYRRRQRRKPQ